MIFLKKYFIQLLETIATVLSPLLAFWLSAWSRNLPPEVTSLSTKEILKNSLRDFSSPIPYLSAAILALLLGRIKGFDNQDKAQKLPQAEARLRAETQSHAESKSSYYDTLKIVLTYLLTSKVPNFNENCRVTVYRAEEDDEKYFRQIFRYSQTTRFQIGGRIKIPIDEGIVGAAWNNHGVKEFKCDSDPTSDEFARQLEVALQCDNCKLPSPNVALSMPSKHFYAKAIQDLENGEKRGIIVYECTNVADLDVAGIVEVLQSESVDMLRFIRHIVVLDRDFNPDSKKA